MNCTTRCMFVSCLSFVSLIAPAFTAHAQFTPPTQEELAMTSQAEVPGAAAVYLFREEETDDRLHYWSKYVRLKVLTEKGKDYANVELEQVRMTEDDGSMSGYTVGNIEGRTIHPDGTIIPFTGKPFEKVVEKSEGLKVMSKAFTLPDVEVGSIIEYRYQMRYDDNRYFAPDWEVQTNLFTRNAHYVWRPTDKTLITKGEHGEELTSRISWASVLPQGTVVKQSRLPSTIADTNGQAVIELKVQNVAPVPDEEYMPPMRSLSYRVQFYYTPYEKSDEYWKNEGKGWSSTTDKFIGPHDEVTAAVKEMVANSDTPDQKLRKLYAAVMKLDNTSFARAHSASEDKSEGLTPPKSTDEILERKRGSDDQLTELFIAMARAAGMKAYAMSVTNRDRSLFNEYYLNFSQLEDMVAVVNVGGKEEFFDPGQRYSAYGHLAWKHTMTKGVRQTEGGTAIAATPGESYRDSKVERIADLKLDPQGIATGTIRMMWTGTPALIWRQASLRGDMTSLNRDLRTSIENLMPSGVEISVASIQNLEEYEQPLVVNFTVKGQIASSTGKRLIIPGDLFEGNAKPTFPHDKRELPVYFNYAVSMADAVRITYPSDFSIESQPTTASMPLNQEAVYSMDAKTAPTSITIFRNLARQEILFPLAEYDNLRAFYNKLETTDQEPIVLKMTAQAAHGN